MSKRAAGKQKTINKDLAALLYACGFILVRPAEGIERYGRSQMQQPPLGFILVRPAEGIERSGE
jgi:hypothetical protein